MVINQSMYYISSEDKEKYPFNLFYPTSYYYGSNIKYTNNFPWHFIEKEISNLEADDLVLIGQPYSGGIKSANQYPRSQILAVLQLPEPEEKGTHKISVSLIGAKYSAGNYRTEIEVNFE